MDDSDCSSISFNGVDCMIDEVVIISANIILIPLIVIGRVPDVVLIPLFMIDICYTLIWIFAIGASHVTTGGEIWKQK